MQSSEEIIFDPDQDAQELRRDYRSLNKKIEQCNPDELTPQEMIGEVKKANELFDSVKRPQEAILDSRFFLLATSIGAQKAREIKYGLGAFEVGDFIKLVHYMSDQNCFEDRMSDDSDAEGGHLFGSPLNWDRIGRKCMAKSRRVPVTGFMLGPLFIEQKMRVVTKRSKLERNNEDERRPQVLNEEDIIRSQNETTGNVSILRSILVHFEIDKDNPLNLFAFVINPKSFAQSVENIFYLSFLIRDGQVQFKIRDGEPVIFLREEPGRIEHAEDAKRRQMVLELDMETWKRAIQVFNITEPFIPHRVTTTTITLDNQWHG